jgi:murein L,D-transpeptidase YcbB/YkuD
VDDLLALADRSRDDGLAPSDFGAPNLRKLLGDRAPESLPKEARADADILLTDALLRLLHHQRYGKVDPQTLDPKWNHVEGPYSVTLVSDLQETLAAKDLGKQVTSILRRPAFYTRLRDGLARYRALAAAGGWPNIPDGPTLEPGMRAARIPVIRERLRITGEYTGGKVADAKRYDAGLEKAVRRFQERNTLGVDGIIGPATLAAMNVTAEQRVEQIRVNLERMRWVGDDMPEDFVLVDIAAQEVRLYRDGSPAWTSRVIVGRPERPTPVFRDQIEYMELNPTWTVPPTILKEDILPKARKNPNAVRKKGLEVIGRNGRVVAPEAVNWNVSANNLPYTLRQPPGDDNALGRVKFMFPNRYSVYLHDTPNRKLFGRAQRTFSSGCVRVEHPMELAELLLDDPAWSQERIASLIESDRRRTVRLKTPMPVLLSYWTAEAGEDGAVRFRQDIYERDAAVLAALDGSGHMRLVYGEPPVEGATAPTDKVADAAGSGQPVAPAAAGGTKGTAPLAKF